MQPENINQNTAPQQLPTQPIQAPQPVMFAPDNPGQPFSPRKSNKKLFIIIGIVILLVLVVGSWFVISNKGNTKNVEVKTQVDKEETDPVNIEQIEKVTPIANNNDAERKEIATQILSYVIMYQANNNGNTLPDSSFLDKELTSKPGSYAYPLVDSVSKKPYILVDETPKTGEVQYKTNVSCADGGEFKIENSKRAIAVRIMLTNKSIYCNNN